MAVLELVYIGSGCLCEQLVAHADTTDRLALHIHLLLDNLDCIFASVRVARAVGKEESVEVHVGIIIVPWYTYDLNATVDEATDDIGFHTTINKHNPLASTLVILDNILATYKVNKINALIVGLGDIIWLVVKEDFTHHHTGFAQHFGQFASVDACDAWHMFTLQPLGQALFSIPVRVLLAIVGNNDGRSIDSVTLHECGQTIGFKTEWGYAIVAY